MVTALVSVVVPIIGSMPLIVGAGGEVYGLAVTVMVTVLVYGLVGAVAGRVLSTLAPIVRV
jgi:hypothetical protein